MTNEPNSSSSSFRDEGLAAFQRQDLPTAQSKLMAAIQQNPQDGMAFLYLGGVYHQMGHHEEALQALQRAVQLLPQQPQVRYNLGIVQEKLGQNAEAYASYQQAVALQPNYPLAQQGMQRLQSTANVAPQPSPSIYPGAVPTVPAMPAAPYAATPAYTPVAPAAPYAVNQPQAPQGYAPPPPSYGQPVATDLAGNPLPTAQPAYGQPPIGGPAGAPQGAYPPPGPAGYRGQQWTPYASEVMTKEDSFNLGQAFRDIVAILFSPKAFYEEEEGASGFAAPIAMALAFCIIMVAAYYFVAICLSGGNIMALGIGAIIGVIAILFAWAFMTIGNFITAGVLYLASRIFGSRGTYSGAYRASMYATAPSFVLLATALTIAAPFLPKPDPSMFAPSAASSPYSSPYSSSYPSSMNTTMPMQNGRSMGYNRAGMNGTGMNGMGTSSRRMGQSTSGYATSPAFVAMLVKYAIFIMIFYALCFIGWIWSVILMVLGTKATQQMSVGSSVGAVVVLHVIWFALGVLYFVATAASAIPH